MSENAIQQAFQKVSLNTGSARLYTLAVELLRQSGGNVFIPRQSFIEAVLKDRDILEAFVSELALEYLDRVKTDMDGSAIVKTEADGGGQFKRDAQDGSTPSTSTKTGSMPAAAERTGHLSRDIQVASARPPAPPSQTPSIKTAGGGQTVGGPHTSGASPYSILTWSPHDIGKKNPLPRTPYQKPTDRVSAEAQARMKNAVAETVLDTIKVRGLPIGDWISDKALAEAENMDWDSRVLRAFAHGVPPGRLIREFVTPKEAENIRKKLEASRAA